MRKVKVFPELYLTDFGLYYVVSEHGDLYCTTDGLHAYTRSGYRLDEFNMLRHPVAHIKMRWIHVDQ